MVAVVFYAVGAVAVVLYGQLVLPAPYSLPNRALLLGPLLTLIPPMLYQPVWLGLCNGICLGGILLCLRARGVMAWIAWILFAVGWLMMGGALFTLIVV